jgi:class 3 adenylate cyclase
MSTIAFLPDAPNVQHAIAASFDLSGFSLFCRRPDAHAYLNRFLSALFKDFDNSFKDGFRDFFKDTSKLIQVPRPDMAKYTGDGALLIWARNTGADFSADFCTNVVAALRLFQQSLPAKVAQWEREWRATDLPKAARFGIATGPVHPLTQGVTTFNAVAVDYAGYCINLAVRLQDHCPAVSFIIHQPLRPQIPGLIPLKALKMKGSLDEPVFVFAEDFDRFRANHRREARLKFAA